jgi:pimeloyl-ACP methyl ester carboxylesterase
MAGVHIVSQHLPANLAVAYVVNSSVDAWARPGTCWLPPLLWQFNGITARTRVILTRLLFHCAHKAAITYPSGTMQALPATSRVRLDGRRQLSYRTYGQLLSNANHVLLYHHGWPSCSLEAALLHTAAEELGLAIVALDRPGVEDSSMYPGCGVFDIHASKSSIMLGYMASRCFLQCRLSTCHTH